MLDCMQKQAQQSQQHTHESDRSCNASASFLASAGRHDQAILSLCSLDGTSTTIQCVFQHESMDYLWTSAGERRPDLHHQGHQVVLIEVMHVICLYTDPDFLEAAQGAACDACNALAGKLDELPVASGSGADCGAMPHQPFSNSPTKSGVSICTCRESDQAQMQCIG